jgi:hypothetical protein
MEKEKVESIIEKYYLGGLCESVKWDIKNKNLFIRFVSPNKDMAGELTCSNFNLENSEPVIYNTTQLLKLVNTLDKEITISLYKSGKTFNRMFLSDKTFNVTYSLTDPMMVPHIPEITEPEEYEIILNLDKNHINNLIKAKNSLPNDKVLSIRDDKNIYGNRVLIFTFGDENDYSNKISYEINLDTETETYLIDEPIPFDSDMLKVILNSNKHANNILMSINMEGLMKLEFIHDDLSTKYFLLRRADI